MKAKEIYQNTRATQPVLSCRKQLPTHEQLIADQAKAIAELRAQVHDLLSQVAWLNRQLFGRKSEKLAHLDPNQPSLFDMPPAPLPEPVPAETLECPRHSAPTPNAIHRNRKHLDELPVVEVFIEPKNIDHARYKCIGQERTRTLEFEPGRLYVKEIVRPKYGLRDNTALPKEGEGAVVIAPLPLLPINKGLPGASLLAEVLLQKYEYHVPFHRQVRSLGHLGLRIPESTLSGWFEPVCELLRPLYDELRRQVLQCDYIQVDETTIPVIDNSAGRAKKEYLWVVRSPIEKSVFFHYDGGSRSGATAAAMLQSFKGYLQCDGYDAYRVFEKSPKVCLVACMAHIRRAFEKALDEHRSLAEYALAQVQTIYRIERTAGEQGVASERRRELREELVSPILDELGKWMERTYPTVLPKSRIGQAIAYAYALWPRMKNYLRDGRLEIDNNGAERAIRPIALSRKNFLFCGNHRSAADTAVICSLLASCKEQGLNPRAYLTDILARLPYYTCPGAKLDLGELLPQYWRAKEIDSLSDIPHTIGKRR